jgi:peptidoglycan/LPS O-acetylase OafA/YrhL
VSGSGEARWPALAVTSLGGTVAAVHFVAAPLVDPPAASLVFGVVIGVAVFCFLRHMRWATVALGALFCIEILAFPCYDHSRTTEFVAQLAILVASAAALLILLAGRVSDTRAQRASLRSDPSEDRLRG